MISDDDAADVLALFGCGDLAVVEPAVTTSDDLVPGRTQGVGDPRVERQG